MDVRKFLLLLVFCFSGYLLFDAWVKEHQPPETPQTTNATQIQSPASSSATIGEKSLALPQQTGQSVTSEKITVKTDYLVAEIDLLGGDLTYLELLKHKATEDKTKKFVLFRNDDKRKYIAQSGLLGEGLPNHKTQFTSAEKNYQLDLEKESMSVRLFAQSAHGDRIIKTYTFNKSRYLIDVAFEIQNNQKSSFQTDAYFQLVRDSSPPEGANKLMPTYTGMAFYSETDKYKKISFSDVDKNKAPAKSVNNGWVAMVQHYFVSAWIPKAGSQREAYFKKLNDTLYATGVVIPVGKINPGETLKSSVQLYAGPEEQNRLSEISPGLELTADYGWLTIVAKPLFWVLQKIHHEVGNWGVAIILLTVIVKLIFYPLSAASYKSMARTRMLTPKLQKLREQYANDRQKLHLAMVELYKTEKVSPLGGCLPIVVQIPVFIALYWVLLAAVELRHAPFFLWIHDLSVADPYFILPVLMGVSMFVQVSLNPSPPDPIQAKVMKIMPIAFSIFFFFFPAGLVLYWVVNNLLSIAQQWQITRSIERAKAAHGKR